MKNHTEVVVSTIPKCQFCEQPAMYDAVVGRPWGYVCNIHFAEYECKVGLGLGQKLILRDTNDTN